MRLLFALAILMIPAAAEAGMRCDKRLVSRGHTPYQVRALCGAPMHSEATTEVRTIRRRRPGVRGRGLHAYVERTVYVPVERWTYADEGRLIRHLTFENGRLVAIRTGARTPTGEGSVERCKTAILGRGDSTAEVLLKCGTPVDVHRWYEEIAAGGPFGEQRAVIPHERWTYDLGTNRFLRILHFREGVLVNEERVRAR